MTLNGADRVDQRRVLATMHYEHPIYTPESVAARTAAVGAQRRRARVRRRLPRLGLPRGRLRGRGARGRVAGRAVVTATRGACGRAPVSARRRLRSTTSRCATCGTPRCTATSATASTCGWSTSTRCPGSRSGCGRSPGSGRPTTSATRAARSAATSTATWQAAGVDLRGGRVLMLANARVLGYVFNPLTVYWCHRPDGSLACVVAEVHNTYGERHCYLLRHRRRGPGAGGEGVLRVAVPGRRRRVPHAPARARRAAEPRDHVAAERVDGVRRERGRGAHRRHPARARPHGGRADRSSRSARRPSSAGTASRCGCAASPSSPDRATHRRRASNDHVPHRPAVEQPLRATARRRRLAGLGHPTALRAARPHRGGPVPPRGAPRCPCGWCSRAASASAAAARSRR